MSYILSGKKFKILFFCATQIMLNSLSSGYIALGETETGRQNTDITLFTWYDLFHDEVTIKWTSLPGTLSKPYYDRKP